MSYRGFFGGLGLLVALAGAPAAFADAGKLTVVGAGGVLQDAERKAFFEPFATSSGVVLTEDSYSGQMAKVRAMVDSGSVSWDVMQVEQNTLLSGCAEGLFEELDWSRIGKREDFIPEAYSDCGVGAFVWSMVPSYDKVKLADGPKNWADLWNVEKWPGKRGFRQTAKMTLEIALLADGVAKDKVYEVLATDEGQDRAFAKLDEIKPSILWWATGAESVERLAAGDVVATATFNSRVAAANASGKDFALIWDGQVFGIDYWGIVKGSPNRENAQKFIAFASTESAQAAFPQHIAYGVTNLAAIRGVKPEIAKDLPTTEANMASAVALNTEFWADHGEALEARFATWRAQ
ncbi:spermidine/putrescine ABC transporter substrate-binding protein [Sinorhizobium sp. Sb3]|uniref:ABC transporter substrate-binding protein n=1 Tax=Sinorhizobium sp. Sb3 TaxID=1358417 RepID=UPI00071DBF89|nr:ABC transporter substrate-binding protein [Sinorhizobium sp. Sb3]KSV66665.1 spermidine/putrescine ABC transporter substrate-binding protein [Sinorhizobium sp. Sb3]